MTDTDAILKLQRDSLSRIADLCAIPSCALDQADLLRELLIIANAAQALDVAMTSGNCVPTPWLRSYEYRNR